MRKLYLFFILFSCTTLFSQSPLEFEWKENYKIKGKDMISNFQGGLTLVGSIGSGAALFELNQHGDIVFRKTGFAKNSTVNAIVQTSDGGYVLVGWTKDIKERRNAWIIKLDKKKTELWRKSVPIRSSEFYDIIQDEKGNLTACGYANNKMYVGHYTSSGETIWEKSYIGEQPSHAKAIVGSVDKGLYVIGNKKNKKKTTSILFKLNSEGDVIWSQDLYGIGSHDIIENSVGDLVIVGTDQRIVGGEEYADFAKTDGYTRLLIQIRSKEGRLVNSKYFETPSKRDVGYSVIQNFTGEYHATGQSNYPYHKEASKNLSGKKFLLCNSNRMRTGNNDYKKILLDKKIGGYTGSNIVQLYDGSLFVAGYSSNKSFLVKFSPKNRLIYNETNLNISTANYQEIEGNNNGILEPTERAYYSFYLKNEGITNAYNIIANITHIGKGNIEFFPKVHIGYIARGDSALVQIPIIAGEALSSSKHTFAVDFTGNAKVEGAPFKFEVNSSSRSLPSIVIDKIAFQESPAQRTQPNKLSLRIQNKSDEIIEDFYPKIIFPSGVEYDEETVKLEHLAPHESKVIEIDFRLLDSYLDNSVDITFQLLQANQLLSFQQLSLAVQEEVVEEKEEDIVVEVEKYLSLNWVTPSIAINGLYQKVENPIIDLKLQAVSSYPLSKGNFTLLINGKPPTNNGRKFKTVSLLKEENIDQIQQIYSYSYIIECRLGLGENIIEVSVENEAGEAKITPITLEYRSPKPNLYLLSIGVPHADLQFTAKDAQDIANAYEQQEGILFDKVKIKLLNTKSSTRADTLRKSISNIFRDMPGGLQEKDMVIVYISSHGFIKSDDGTFRIAAQDYDKVDIDNTTLSFHDHIYEDLAKLNCTRLVFIDACQRLLDMDKYIEAFKPVSENGSSIAEVMKEYSDILGINSCSPKQYSYEDAQWENSAFAEALLEAFNDSAFDKKNDSVLSFLELYEFLKKRVPEIVSTKKGLSSGETQVPDMSDNPRRGDTPVIGY